jgi:hypothetical protein
MCAHTWNAALDTELQLRRLVTNGPSDLDIASAMAAYGYDAVKWAEGQALLAEWVAWGPPTSLDDSQAVCWLHEALSVAQVALSGKPQLLAKVGLAAA